MSTKTVILVFDVPQNEPSFSEWSKKISGDLVQQGYKILFKTYDDKNDKLEIHAILPPTKSNVEITCSSVTVSPQINMNF